MSKSMSYNKSLWRLNKVTGTNGITKWKDLSSLQFSYSDSNKCPTKSDIQSGIKSGWKVTIPTSYSNNQLVKYSDISVSQAYQTYTLTIKGSYTIICLGNDMTISGNPSFGGFTRLSSQMFEGQGQQSWRKDTGLAINNCASTSGTVKVKSGTTIYIFRPNGTMYSRIKSFILQNSDQTITT